MEYISLIPKMTSNTSPSGIVRAGSRNAEYFEWYAFDKMENPTISNQWISSAVNGKEWISYEFDSRKAVSKYVIRAGHHLPRAPVDFTLEGSNNNADWTVLDTRTGIVWGEAFSTKEFLIDSQKVGQYKVYRLNVSKNNNDTYVSISELDLLEYNITNKTLILSNGEYKNLISKGIVLGGEPKDLTSTPSSIESTATISEGTPICSDYVVVTTHPIRAFDKGLVTTAWNSNLTAGAWIGFDFNKPTMVNKYAILSDSSLGRNPKNFAFQASNDGNDWITLDERENIDFVSTSTTLTFEITNTKVYKMYRIYIHQNNGHASRSGLTELYLYGLQTTVTDIHLPYWENVNLEEIKTVEEIDFNALERKLKTLNPIKMNKSEILLENGKLFAKTIDLKKYMDIRSVNAEVK